MIRYPLFLHRFDAPKKVLIGLSLTIAVLMTSGCGIIYIPDVQQGNMITAENVNRIKNGMTPQQVRFVLGTPLIQDPFHKNRWDYHYSFRSGKTGEVETSWATVIFHNGKVKKVTRNLAKTAKTLKH